MYVPSNQLAASLRSEKAVSSSDVIAKAYRLILNRQPTAEKTQRAVAFWRIIAPSMRSCSPSPNEAAVATNANTNSDSEVSVAQPAATPAGPAAPIGMRPLERHNLSAAATAPVVPVAAPEDSRDAEFKPDAIPVPASADPDAAATSAFVQALFAAGEFRYVR